MAKNTSTTRPATLTAVTNTTNTSLPAADNAVELVSKLVAVGGHQLSAAIDPINPDCLFLATSAVPKDFAVIPGDSGHYPGHPVVRFNILTVAKNELGLKLTVKQV